MSYHLGIVHYCLDPYGKKIKYVVLKKTVVASVTFHFFQSESKPASLPDSTNVIYVVVIQSNSLQFPILSF